MYCLKKSLKLIKCEGKLLGSGSSMIGKNVFAGLVNSARDSPYFSQTQMHRIKNAISKRILNIIVYYNAVYETQAGKEYN